MTQARLSMQINWLQIWSIWIWRQGKKKFRQRMNNQCIQCYLSLQMILGINASLQEACELMQCVGCIFQKSVRGKSVSEPGKNYCNTKVVCEDRFFSLTGWLFDLGWFYWIIILPQNSECRIMEFWFWDSCSKKHLFRYCTWDLSAMKIKYFTDSFVRSNIALIPS